MFLLSYALPPPTQKSKRGKMLDIFCGIPYLRTPVTDMPYGNPRGTTMNKHSAALAYELLCVSVFRNNGFLIEHCGRKGDKGVDFRGHWTISNGKTIPIIGMFEFILLAARQ